MRNRRWLLSLVLAGPLAVAVSGVAAQETFKVAVGELGLWAVDAPRLGQRAGIFKKHGLVLDIFGTSGGGDPFQAGIFGRPRPPGPVAPPPPLPPPFHLPP